MATELVYVQLVQHTSPWIQVYSTMDADGELCFLPSTAVPGLTDADVLSINPSRVFFFTLARVAISWYPSPPGSINGYNHVKRT